MLPSGELFKKEKVTILFYKAHFFSPDFSYFQACINS